MVARDHRMRRLFWSLILASLVCAPALGQELDRAAEYRQSPAVLARYPDVVIAIDTPALKPGRTSFTSQDETMCRCVSRAPASSPRRSSPIRRAASSVWDE